VAPTSLERVRAGRYVLAATILSFLVGVAGIIVLVAWNVAGAGTLRLLWLWDMAPNTALCLVLSSISLLLLLSSRTNARRWTGRVVAGLVIVVSSATILEHLWRSDLGMDGLLLFRTLNTPIVVRMLPNPAVGFVCLGAALVSLDSRWRRFRSPSQILAIAVMVIGLLGLLSHLFAPTGFVSHVVSPPSIALLGLAAALILARPRTGLGALLLSNTSGGVLTRRLLVPIVVLPVIVAFLRLEGQRIGLYGTGLGTALFAALVVAWLIGLVWAAAVAIDLRESRLLAILKTSTDAIVSADESGTITDVNVGAERMFGYGPSELVGRPLTVLMPERFHDGFVAGLKRFLETESSDVIGSVVEFTGRRRDGGEFPLDLSLSEWSLHGVHHFTGVMRDISERKRAQEELKRSNEDLEQFAYAASHDLQEPLRMVTGYVGLLAQRYQGKLDEDADEFIGFAVDGAERMKELISDILEYSRVNSRPKPLASVPLDEVVEEATRNLSVALEESDGRVGHEDLPVVEGDRSQLLELFQNLIGNSLKFRSEEKPLVRISAARDNGMWRVTVADNGIGIEPAYREKVFAVFQRLHTRSEYPGTGIGLALCKRVVERHGGAIWIEPGSREGTTIHLTLKGADGAGDR